MKVSVSVSVNVNVGMCVKETVYSNPYNFTWLPDAVVSAVQSVHSQFPVDGQRLPTRALGKDWLFFLSYGSAVLSIAAKSNAYSHWRSLDDGPPSLPLFFSLFSKYGNYVVCKFCTASQPASQPDPKRQVYLFHHLDFAWEGSTSVHYCLSVSKSVIHVIVSLVDSACLG